MAFSGGEVISHVLGSEEPDTGKRAGGLKIAQNAPEFQKEGNR